MLSELFINWNPNPVLFGPVRYYGLLWALGIALSYIVVQRVYKDKGIAKEKFEPLFLYCFLGILIGARLGHCIFYEPDRFLTSPTGIIEMLLPIQRLHDGWHITGYAGLASHGGTIGLIIALWLYCRKTKMHYMDVLDIIAVATPICAGCIRIANLMNSEIIGMPSKMPWAFVFERVDMIPRHPAQLYEALAYFLLFGIMILLYRKIGKTVHRGFFFGLCLTYIFVFRFFVEFIKEDQVAFEQGMTFNMGQLLSIPFILIGIYFMFFYKGRKTAE